MTDSVEKSIEKRYSKKEINDIGKEIKNDNTSENNLKIITKWRSSHYHPLSMISGRCRKIAIKIDKKARVVQRLKRFTSIEYKLKNTHYDVWEIQDIGGCRIIVNDVDAVYKFKTAFSGGRSKNKIIYVDDYIGKDPYESTKGPKKSGYRGIHMICEYHSDKNENYNGMKIEIQIRTKLQHVWATTIETWDQITNQNLKSGKGDEEISRFFILASSLFCILENCKLVPNTPPLKEEILKEMKKIDEKHKIIQTLEKHKAKSKKYPNNKSNNLPYILSLNKTIKNYSDQITNYMTSIESGSTKEILHKYDDIEIKEHMNYLKFKDTDEEYITSFLNSYKKYATINNVLTFGDTNYLKETYPNYYLDTREFVKIVKTQMDSIT